MLTMAPSGAFAVGLAAAGLAVLITFKIFRWMNYFRDRNIPYIPGVWPLGSSFQAAFFRQHYVFAWSEYYYKMTSHKYFGFYVFTAPIVMVRDPELINRYIQTGLAGTAICQQLISKQETAPFVELHLIPACRIFTSDFSHFVDRGFTVNEKKDPLDANLFFLSGEKWRYLRNKLSPVFTSGNLKWMFEQMQGSTEKFLNFFEKNIPMGQDTNLREVLARLTTDVISSCGFGINSNAMGDPDSEFREIGKIFFKPSILNTIKFFGRFQPALFNALNIRNNAVEVDNFFINLVDQAFNHRLKTGYVRKDYVQLLLQLREKGHVEVGEICQQPNEGSGFPNYGSADGLNESVHQKELIEIDNGVMAAQLFVFFIAGFETTSSTLYHLTYLLSLNQDCQEKAREEAKRAFDKYGDFTFDSLKELPYIDNCIKETLRMFPVVPFLFRVCTNDYTLPDGLRIQKGEKMMIPLYSIQNDPKYFPEPDKFNPERFNGPITKGTYVPFGDGPRICIGKRFAEAEIKLALSKILLNYKLTAAEPKADLKNWAVGSILLNVKDPLLVKVEKIQ